MSENDALLLRRFADVGDPEAFAAIVRQYAGFVFGTCRRVLGNESEASDAAQETFFYLLKNANHVTGSLGGWLHRVAVNRSRDLLRADVARRKREAAYSAETWRETNQWDDIAPAVDEALESLPPEERELLMRHFLQGQSMVQIAAMDGISQPTVSRRVAAALEHLRTELRQRGVLAGVAILGATLPQAAEAAPDLLLQGLGKMVLSQAATTSAVVAGSSGAGGIAAKISSALAAATAVSLKVKLATCALVVAVGTGAVIVHRATHASQESSAQADFRPAPSGARLSPDNAKLPIGSSLNGMGNSERTPGFAGNRDAALGNQALGGGREPARYRQVTEPVAQAGAGSQGDTGFSFSVQSSSFGGSSFTNFSFNEEHAFGDGTQGGRTAASGGGGGGVYAGLGGRGSVLRLAALAEVRKELGLSTGQKDAVKAIVERVRAFEDRMRSEIRQMPIQSRGPAMASKFAEAEQEVARAREEISILLTASQARRLEQISLQDSGATALFRPDVIQTLGLSPEQQQRLAEIQDQAGEEVAAMHGVTMHGSGNRPRTNAAPQSLREIMQGAERRMVEEVLMAWQQARLRELQGTPFAFPANYLPPMGMVGVGAGAGGAGGRVH